MCWQVHLKGYSSLIQSNGLSLGWLGGGLNSRTVTDPVNIVSLPWRGAPGHTRNCSQPHSLEWSYAAVPCTARWLGGRNCAEKNSKGNATLNKHYRPFILMIGRSNPHWSYPMCHYLIKREHPFKDLNFASRFQGISSRRYGVSIVLLSIYICYGTAGIFQEKKKKKPEVSHPVLRPVSLQVCGIHPTRSVTDTYQTITFASSWY